MVDAQLWNESAVGMFERVADWIGWFVLCSGMAVVLEQVST